MSQGQYAPPPNTNQVQYAPPPNANQGQMVPPEGAQMVQIAGDLNHRPNYMGKAAMGLGIAQIVIGAAIFLAQICANLAQTALSPGGSGYWMGLFFIITGLVGILSGKSKKKNMIVVFLVLCIVAALIAGALVIVGGISTLLNGFTGGGCREEDNCYRDINQYAVDIALSILGFIEIIVAIISSGFGCAGLCCFRQMQKNQVVYTQDGQVLIVTNGQGAAGGYQQQMVPATGYQPQVGTSGGYQPQGPQQYDFQEKKTNGIP